MTRLWGLAYVPEKLGVDLISFKRNKKIVKSKLVKPAGPKVAMTVTKMIA